MPAAAQEVAEPIQTRAVVSIGHGRSDNLGRDDEQDRVSSSFSVLGLNFLVNRERPRLQMNLTGDIDVRHYGDAPSDTDENDVRGSADGTVVAAFVPGVFNWNLGGSFGQTRVNPFDADRPGNRVRVTVFSTGPQLNVPLGGRNVLRFSAQASTRTVEDTGELDSDATVASLGLFRRITPVSELGVEVSTSDIDYDGAQPDYRIDAAYVTYSRDFASGGLQLSLGGDEVTVLGQTRSAEMFQMGWNRDVGTRSNLSVIASRELTDAGMLFRSGGTLAVDGISGARGLRSDGRAIDRLQNARLRDVILTANPLERSSVTLGWRVTGRRTEFLVSSGLWEDRFEIDDALDNDGVHATVEISREFTPRWSGRMDLRAYHRSFDVGSQESDDIVGRLQATRTLGTRSAVTLEYEQYRRDARELGGGSLPGFEESVYTVFFNYAFGQ